jgi:hypothetical protein
MTGKADKFVQPDRTSPISVPPSQRIKGYARVAPIWRHGPRRRSSTSPGPASFQATARSPNMPAKSGTPHRAWCHSQERIDSAFLVIVQPRHSHAHALKLLDGLLARHLARFKVV